MNQAIEDRLRQHINSVLYVTGIDPEETPRVADEVSSRLLDLADEYAKTPDPLKEEVYKRGEERLLQWIRSNAGREAEAY